MRVLLLCFCVVCRFVFLVCFESGWFDVFCLVVLFCCFCAFCFVLCVYVFVVCLVCCLSLWRGLGVVCVCV